LIYTISLFFIEQKPALLIIGSVIGFIAFFTKEASISMLPFVLVILLAGYHVYGKYWGKKYPLWIPVLILLFGIILLFITRSSLSGSMLPTSPAYAPHFDGKAIAIKLIAYASGISNTSFYKPGVTGFGGVGNFLFEKFGDRFPSFEWFDVAVMVVSLFWLVWLLSIAQRNAFPFVVGCSLALLTMAIHLTVGNFQSYYRVDFLVGFTIILALALDKMSKRGLYASSALIILFMTNSFVSAQYSQYTWQYTAQRSQEAFSAIENMYRASHKSILLISSNNGFWRFALGSEMPAPPMIPERLGKPSLEIRYYEYDFVPDNICKNNREVLCVDLDNHYKKYDGPITNDLVLKRITPSETKVNTSFNYQETTGHSALVLFVNNATPRVKVVFNGVELKTAYGLEFISASIPPNLYAVPGSYEVYLVDDSRVSNKIIFIVLP
jgi:hypothetical protein